MDYFILIFILIIIIAIYFIGRVEHFSVVLGNRETLHYPKIYNLRKFFGFIDYYTMIRSKKEGDLLQQDFIIYHIKNIFQILKFLVYNQEYNFYNRILENAYYESYYLDDDSDDRNGYNNERNNLLIYDNFDKTNIMVNLRALKDVIELSNTNDISRFDDIYDQTEIEIFDVYFIKPVKSMVQSMIAIGSTKTYIEYMRLLKGYSF